MNLDTLAERWQTHAWSSHCPEFKSHPLSVSDTCSQTWVSVYVCVVHLPSYNHLSPKFLFHQQKIHDLSLHHPCWDFIVHEHISWCSKEETFWFTRYRAAYKYKRLTHTRIKEWNNILSELLVWTSAAKTGLNFNSKISKQFERRIVVSSKDFVQFGRK